MNKAVSSINSTPGPKRLPPIPVEIDNDQNWARPEWKDVSGQISRMDVAPNGEQVVVAAPGRYFSPLPAKSGITL